MNLLIHQDYGDHSRKAVIKFFRDGIQFWNPGDAFGAWKAFELFIPELDKEADMASDLLKAMFGKTGTSEGHLGAGDSPSLSQVTPEDGATLALSRHQVEILRKCQQNKALLDLIAITGRSGRTKFRRQVLNPLIDMGLIEMTVPDKPRSSKQKYRLTTKGRQVLERDQGGMSDQ